MTIEREAEDYVRSNGPCFISDVARKLKVRHEVASEVVKRLVEANRLTVKNKGVAKIVIFSGFKKGGKIEK